MVRQRQQYLKANYNLTAEDYESMVEVNDGRCWICDGIDERTRDDGSPYPLSVDHNHETGKPRGLLCNRCNVALGLLGDDPAVIERALEYLKLHGHGAVRWPSAVELQEAPLLDKPK